MKKSIVILTLLLVLSLAYPIFEIKSVNVEIDMNKDGSAKVYETVKFYVKGESSQAKYKAGLVSNDLSFWTSTTGLSDLRVHLNSEVVNIQNFRIVPENLINCEDIFQICMGEINMDYDALPYYDINTKEIIKGTGLFSMDDYKPRTTKFSLNSDALFFETAEVEYIIRLNSYTTLTINLPEGSKVLDVSPLPEDLGDVKFPTTINVFTWKNALLVKFSFIYEIEKGLDEEVLDYFYGLYSNFDFLMFGPEGFPTVVIIFILFIFYIALTSMGKKKG